MMLTGTPAGMSSTAAATQEPASLQTVAINGKPKTKVDDVSGPEATEWFAKDIVAHIKHRANDVRTRSNTAGPETAIGAGLADLASFRDQAAHLLAPKWIDFGKPSNGKGVNTVVVAGHTIRKNQLGNIEFGIISDLFPPPFYKHPVTYAYKGEGPELFERLPGYGAKDVNSFNPDHPHANDNLGEFKGLYRADNLAAFGVGHGIADSIKQLEIYKEIHKRIGDDSNKPIMIAEQEAQLTKEVVKLLNNLFNDQVALGRRVNKYHELLSEKSGIKNIKLSPDTLFFVPSYGGFNTDSLTIPPNNDKQPYKGLNSIEQFDRLKKEYDMYKKIAGPGFLELGEWLKEYHEKYTGS